MIIYLTMEDLMWDYGEVTPPPRQSLTDFHDLTINSFDFAGEDENEDAPYAPKASEGADAVGQQRPL